MKKEEWEEEAYVGDGGDPAKRSGKVLDENKKGCDARFTLCRGRRRGCPGGALRGEGVG